MLESVVVEVADGVAVGVRVPVWVGDVVKVWVTLEVGLGVVV